MWLLAVDTATDTTTIGLGRDGEVVAANAASGRRHSRQLLPLVQRLLAEYELVPRSLDLVGVGLGPGSFTGVRLGLTFAKSLSMSLGIPLVGVSTLEVMAAAWEGGGEFALVPILDAFKGQVYAAAYERDHHKRLQRLLDVAAWQPEVLLRRLQELGRPLVVGGSGLARYRELFSGALAQRMQLAPAEVSEAPTGCWLVKACWQRLQHGGASEHWELEPNYCRPADAELKRREPKS